MKESYVMVKLNECGWKMYKEKNGFASSNIDEKGYSRFSYDYFEELFYPRPYIEFCDDIQNENQYKYKQLF